MLDVAYGLFTKVIAWLLAIGELCAEWMENAAVAVWYGWYGFGKGLPPNMAMGVVEVVGCAAKRAGKLGRHNRIVTEILTILRAWRGDLEGLLARASR